MEIVKALINLNANVNTVDDLGSDALIKGDFIYYLKKVRSF